MQRLMGEEFILHQPDEVYFMPGKHSDHAAGLFYLQDSSSRAVAEIVARKPGEQVLDLAAAKGRFALRSARLNL